MRGVRGRALYPALGSCVQYATTMNVTTRLEDIGEAHEGLQLDLRCGQCGRRLDVLELGHDWRTSRPSVVTVWGTGKVKRPDDNGRPLLTKPTLVREAVGPDAEHGEGRRRWVCHPKRCRADYTIRTDKLEAAFAAAAMDGQRPVVAGVDV